MQDGNPFPLDEGTKPYETSVLRQAAVRGPGVLYGCNKEITAVVTAVNLPHICLAVMERLPIDT